MAEMISTEDIVNVKRDLNDISECISGNDTGLVTPRLGDSFSTLPVAIASVENKGGYITAPNLAALNAIVPEYNHQVARLDDTGNEYRWNPAATPSPKWEATGKNYIQYIMDILNANPMFKSVAVVAGNNANNFIADGKYKLSANLAVGNLTNWAQDSGGFHQSGTIFVLGIASGGVDYPTQIYFPYINNFKIKVRRKISGTSWEAWGTISTLEDLMSVFVSKSDLSANNAAMLSEIAQYSYFGKQFTPAEISGNSVYSNNLYYVGLNGNHTSAVNFNKIKANIWNPTEGAIEYRIYTGSNVTAFNGGYYVAQANTANFAYQGTCLAFPTSDSDVTEIDLGQIVSISANVPFVILFKHNALATFRAGYHTALSGNLISRGFNFALTATAGWALTISITNPTATPNGFIQSGFKLLLDVVKSSGSSTEDYKPKLVLASDIYVLPDQFNRIYLEHLVAEDHTQYEYDVACVSGFHQKRGWWWKPAVGQASTTFPITINAYHKQTAALLASTASTVNCTALSASAGNKVILTIGDSTLVSGNTTQKLLDMSATDVMKVQLIGTRGSGANKFEARGGWTIADYTGPGRTYYSFTVSGVVEAPAINATAYTIGSTELLVQEVNLVSGSGTITCSLSAGPAPTVGSSGTLTKKNASAGDATIAYSNVQPVAGNPFWDGSAINFANYLSVNSFAAPAIVFIQLGINDTINLTSDAAVEAFTVTAFNNLDVLINSIKAANASTKVVLCMPSVFASQDAFGENYGCNQNAFRSKRNIVTYNRKLKERYEGQKANRIYVISSGASLDTFNNFPSVMRNVNEFNEDKVYMQTNAVHAAAAGEKQIGVSWFATAKAL